MFNLFKKANNNTTQNAAATAEYTEQQSAQQYDNADTASQELKESKPKVHGEDGVCCGGCGGQ